MQLASPSAPEATPPTNRGVYPLSGWSDSAFDYYRATVDAAPNVILADLARDLASLGRPVAAEKGREVVHYSEHVELRDRLGRVVCSLFWGGQNVRSNVEAKGCMAPLVFPTLRSRWEHFPSRVDVKRDAAAANLFVDLRARAAEFQAKYGIALEDHANNDPDKGDTFYLGSRKSQSYLRVYQPLLKQAQEQGRTGDAITLIERETVRVELEFKPQKSRAKIAAATLSPDQMWGVSPWIADFAGEAFAMEVQPVSVSERRESNRNRALRFMATQYRAHLSDLMSECQGDIELFGSTLLDLADIPYRN